MIDLFHSLNEEEKALFLEAIPLVTVLIAGADGVIDQHEKDWSVKLTKIRSYAHPESLNDYYLQVGDHYSDKLEALINSLPKDVEERERVITEKLAGLNDILPKLDPKNAYYVYDSLCSFAKHVAKSSGGFLRIGAISPEENRLIGLPMITPIEAPEEEDEV